MPLVVDLDQPPVEVGFGADIEFIRHPRHPGHRVIPAVVHRAFHLEARQHVAIGQPQERMRVAEAGQVVERRVDFRVERIAQVHHRRRPRLVVVGEQHRAFGHPVFGVVVLLAADARCSRGDQRAVCRRRRIGIDHRDEILAFAIRIARPGEGVVPGSGGGRRGRGQQQRDCQRAAQKLLHGSPRFRLIQR